MSKEQIKELFASLSKEHQVELLRELSSSIETSASITEFCQIHQRLYGKNVEFGIIKKGLDHMPTVTATAHTAFGNFEGAGSNKNIAKAKAVDKALAELQKMGAC